METGTDSASRKVCGVRGGERWALQRKAGCCEEGRAQWVLQAVNGAHRTSRGVAGTRAPGLTADTGEKAVQRSEGEDSEPRIL